MGVFLTRGKSLYLMSGGGHLKIGVARDPVARRQVLQTGCSYPLVLQAYTSISDTAEHDGVEVEGRLHRACSKYRVHGEWFDMPLDMISTLWHIHVAPDVCVWGSSKVCIECIRAHIQVYGGVYPVCGCGGWRTIDGLPTGPEDVAQAA